MENCPFCGEELESLSRKIKILENQLHEISAIKNENIGKEQDFGEVMYVASKYGTSFHRKDCVWAAEISEANLIEFSGHEEAAVNYKPCKTCRS